MARPFKEGDLVVLSPKAPKDLYRIYRGVVGTVIHESQWGMTVELGGWNIIGYRTEFRHAVAPSKARARKGNRNGR